MQEQETEEYKTQEQITKEWVDGNFETKLKLEIACQDKNRPFLIFRRITNPKKPGNRDMPLECPFVFYLDGVSGVVDLILRYENKGMKIAFSNIPDSEDSETEDRLQPVRDYCNRQTKLRDEIRAQILAEYGIEDKFKKKLELKAKKDVENIQ